MTTEEMSRYFDEMFPNISKGAHPIRVTVTPPAPTEDERFADLDKYVDIVSRVIETQEEARLDAEKKLYGLVMLLNREGRIHGAFAVQPYKDAEIERLDKQIAILTKRFDEFVKARGAIGK